MKHSVGYEELQHTADWALRVWAPSVEALFEQAACGMNALTGMALVDEPRIRHTYSCAGFDPESMLIGFLSELIYYTEQERLGFDQFEIRIVEDQLSVEMQGAPLLAINKMIKAVTYHELKIRQVGDNFEVVIVFDV